MKKVEYNFKCYTYGKKGKTACSAHHIRECDLTQIVLDDLRRVTHFARMKERQFAAHINQKNSAELRQEMNRVLRELDAMKKRSAELSKLFKRLYEDNVLGRVTDEQYRMLSGDYTDEQRMLEEQIPQKEQRLAQLQAREANVDAFIEKAKQYTAIDTLTPELLRLFIQRIEVGERETKYSRNSSQSVRIIYRDIGTVDSAMQPDEKQPKLLPPLSESHSIPGIRRRERKRERRNPLPRRGVTVCVPVKGNRTTSGLFCAQFLKSEKKISKRVLAKSVDLNLYARDLGPLFRRFFGKAARFCSRQSVEF